MRLLAVTVLLCFSVSKCLALSPLQTQALRAVLDWIVDPHRGKGELPQRRDFDALDLSVRQLMGEKPYDASGSQADQAIFASPREFWLSLREFGKVQGIQITLLKLRIPPKCLFDDLREEALELLLNWSLQHPEPRLPLRKDFGYQPGQIPIRYVRLTGTDHYARGGAAQAAALFPDVQDFWMQYHPYAKKRGFHFRLLDVHFRGDTKPELRQLLREEAHALVFQWIQQHQGELPLRCHFGFNPGQIPVDYNRLMALNLHAPNGPAGRAALFSSPRHFWLEHQAYAQAREYRIELSDKHLQSGQTSRSGQNSDQLTCEKLLRTADSSASKAPWGE